MSTETQRSESLSTEAAGASASGRRLLVAFGAVALVAIGHAAHDASDGGAPWRHALSSGVILLHCAVLAVGGSAMTRWRAPRAAAWAGAALASAASGILFMWLHAEPGRGSPARIAGSAIIGASFTILWLLVHHLPAVLERARLHALEVEGLRRDAELARLRVHLHPHFTLNTLNAIAGLVTEDAAEARRLLAALGDLVRDALSDGDELRPFGDEAAWLRRYAEILESRHRGVLSFRWALAQDTLATRVPRLLLQPLVENAVRHGALRRPDGGSVLVQSETLDGGAVRFVVEDDGPGLGSAPREGLGLRLVRRRLALLCPGGALRFAPVAVGTRAVVEVPAPRGDRA